MFEMRSVGAPHVSPDGAWIAYTVGRTSLDDERSYTRIYMSSAEGGVPIALTAEGKSAGSPAWSPDGRYITFTASRDEGETGFSSTRPRRQAGSHGRSQTRPRIPGNTFECRFTM
jgi:Tol biopolymer transport system component